MLDKLFPLAAGYSASVSAEQTVITGRVHKDNMKDYYPLFMDAILHPGFQQEDLDRIKSQTLNTWRTRSVIRATRSSARRCCIRRSLPAPGTAHTTDGLIGAVRSITLEDVRDFYRKHYTADNVVIGIGGGYDRGPGEPGHARPGHPAGGRAGAGTGACNPADPGISRGTWWKRTPRRRPSAWDSRWTCCAGRKTGIRWRWRPPGWASIAIPAAICTR